MSIDFRSLLNNLESLPLLGIEELLKGRRQKDGAFKPSKTLRRGRGVQGSPAPGEHSPSQAKRGASRQSAPPEVRRQEAAMQKLIIHPLTHSLSLRVTPSPRPPLCHSSPFLIVAPHPDDETLGCGGAIALLRQLNLPVAVLVISDGTKSHPNSRKYPAPALKKLREQESLAALAILDVEAEAITFFGLPDCAVPTPEAAEYQAAIACCRDYLTRLAPTTIFLPWRDDPHRDHRATWKLIDDASKALPYSPRLIEYPIWSWNLEKPTQITESISAWRLEMSAVVEQKQQAIAQYRSQITNLIDDDPEGFRLAPEMLANFARPWEVYLEVR